LQQATARRQLQYIDYAHALVRWATSLPGQIERDFWTGQLASAETVTLESDHPREPVERQRDTIPFGILPDDILGDSIELPRSVHDALVALARREGVSPAAVYQAALAQLLGRDSGRRQIWFVNTVTPRFMLHLYRPLSDVQGMVTTVIPVPIPLTGNTFGELVRDTNTAMRNAYDHSLARVYEWTPHPLRRIMFNYIPHRMGTDVTLGAEVRGQLRGVPLPPLRRQTDLHVNVFEGSQDVYISWLFAKRLFRRESATPYLQRYVEMLQQLAT
jgi:non-ribosomal peptide synthetase component F